MLKGIRDFGDGMAAAGDGASVTDRLAGGGMGVGGGIVKSKFDTKKMPVVMHDRDPQQDGGPIVIDSPPIINDTEERRKRSAITRGLRMNQLDPMEIQE